MVQGLNSSRFERFSVIQYHPNWFWEPPSLQFSGFWGSYLEVNLPVHETGHSSPPSAKVNNEWSYATSPPICLRVVERGNLPFLTFTFEFASQIFWMFLLLGLFYFITYIFSLVYYFSGAEFHTRTSASSHLGRSIERRCCRRNCFTFRVILCSNHSNNSF
jgi:hypothetical protein